MQETYDFDRMPKRSSTSIGCNSTFIYRSLYEENGADESIFFIDEAEDTTILGCKGVNLAKADYICLRKKGISAITNTRKKRSRIRLDFYQNAWHETCFHLNETYFVKNT